MSAVILGERSWKSTSFDEQPLSVNLILFFYTNQRAKSFFFGKSKPFPQIQLEFYENIVMGIGASKIMVQAELQLIFTPLISRLSHASQLNF